ncbi:MAG: ATP-binding protein [Anaerotardibacter sp.]
MPDIFDGIYGQPRVRSFFRATVKNNSISHAYLFTGPAGSSKTFAAWAFAQAIVCEKSGCNSCKDCNQAKAHKHPDIHYLAPEGARGYLVEQIREVVADSMLAPVQARKKVYIIDRADLLGVQPANAFLKTLEEPLEDVVFILMGRTVDAVLPTVVSRCQLIPFRPIPESESVGILMQNTGVSQLNARIALSACDGSLTKAISFAKSSERFEFRREVIDVLESLRVCDDADVLQYAQDLIERAKAPLDNVRQEQNEYLNESAEYLSRSAIRQIEMRNKRALTQATFDALGQLTSVVRSWLRDIMMIVAGTQEYCVNVDRFEQLCQAAEGADLAQIMRALDEARKTDEAIQYNVSPETCLDALLFTIRKVLYGSGSAH